MPLHWTISHAHRLVIAIAKGDVEVQEVEAYLETALKAPAPQRSPDDRPAGTGAGPTADGPVVVLDFGSQFAQLIARRVRELDVYSELLPHDTPYEDLERRGTRAIILSGGPMSVYDDGAPMPDPAVWSGRIPVLGICYGAQLMARELGGDGAELLDVEARELVIEGRRVPLTPLEFSVMSYLHEHEDSAVSRESLLRDVWGHRYDAGSNVVDVVVRALRKKLGQQAGMIETVAGFGYRFRQTAGIYSP